MAATRVRQIRQARGLSQEQVARLAGLSLRQVQVLDTDHGADPKLSTLRKLAKALGCQVRELVG